MPFDLVPGLERVDDFVDTEAERSLLATIDALPWRDDLERRVQHYGWVYDYRRRTVDGSLYLGPLPAWASNLAERIYTEGWMTAVADQVIVNEYQPGQGISKHIDCKTCFGPTIASLSLAAATTMVFERGHASRVELWLPARSLLVLARAAREDWTHRIPARKSDVIEGRRQTRARRISLTFRVVRR